MKGIFDCRVMSVKNLVADIFLMRLHCPTIAEQVLPGQFVNIKVNQEYIPLLRKPFSIARRSRRDGWIEILWQIVGKGTSIMAGFRKGDLVDVLGPLGKGYSISDQVDRAFLVAGGLGVAPMPFLCKELLKSKRTVDVFIGARSHQGLAMLEHFEELGVELHVATEDGSSGRKGFITEVVTERLQSLDQAERAFLYSCGPTPFLNRMIEITEEYGVEGEVAIETMMGCGFGICVGCPVRVRQDVGDGKYFLTCLDGPVFNARTIVLHD